METRGSRDQKSLEVISEGMKLAQKKFQEKRIVQNEPDIFIRGNARTDSHLAEHYNVKSKIPVTSNAKTKIPKLQKPPEIKPLELPSIRRPVRPAVFQQTPASYSIEAPSKPRPPKKKIELPQNTEEPGENERRATPAYSRPLDVTNYGNMGPIGVKKQKV